MPAFAPTFVYFIASPQLRAGENLFDVLQLLAQLFDLCLHADHQLGDRHVLRFRRDGIDLAIELLHQKIDAPPHGLRLFQTFAQLRDVRVKPHRFLGYGAAVSHYGHLGQQPRLVHVLPHHFLNGSAQPRLVGRHGLGIARLDGAGHFLNVRNARSQIALHFRALSFAHGAQPVQRARQRQPKWVSALIYLAMGWCLVFKLPVLATLLPVGGMALLIAGGLSYSVGCVFYVLKRIPYSHMVFHFFVLGGSVCHTLAVLLFVF